MDNDGRSVQQDVTRTPDVCPPEDGTSPNTRGKMAELKGGTGASTIAARGPSTPVPAARREADSQLNTTRTSLTRLMSEEHSAPPAACRALSAPKTVSHPGPEHRRQPFFAS